MPRVESGDVNVTSNGFDGWDSITRENGARQQCKAVRFVESGDAAPNAQDGRDIAWQLEKLDPESMKRHRVMASQEERWEPSPG